MQKRPFVHRYIPDLDGLGAELMYQFHMDIRNSQTSINLIVGVVECSSKEKGGGLAQGTNHMKKICWHMGQNHMKKIS